MAKVTFFQDLFAGIADESGAEYLSSTNSDWGGKSGFRIDFVVYSFMPVRWISCHLRKVRTRRLVIT